MKNMKKYTFLIASLFLLGGCAANQTVRQLETQPLQGERQVVKISADQAAPGFGDLQLSLELKTRNHGTLLFDTAGYGTEKYALLVRVNGKPLQVAGGMTGETGDYRGSRDPEAGNGVRYRFATTLRLPVGMHTLICELPGEGVVFEQQVVVGEGVNRLKLQPVYKRKDSHRLIGFYGDTTYYEGVRRLTVAGSGA